MTFHEAKKRANEFSEREMLPAFVVKTFDGDPERPYDWCNEWELHNYYDDCRVDYATND